MKQKNIFTEFKTIIENLKIVANSSQNTLITEEVKKLEVKIAKKEFLLIILGQYKRGKSTLINALLAQKLLPTSIIPLTSIITIIAYGDKPKCVVEFFHKKPKILSISKLPEFITEGKNPKNIKGVKKVFINLPNDFLKQGIRLVDTPGVGSIYQHNTDLSYKFVKQADMAIFLISPDPPISQAELKFLQTIKNDLAKIIFVQNKIDQIEAGDLQKSFQFSQKVINEVFDNKKIRLYQVSAKKGLEGKIENNPDKIQTSNIIKLEEQLKNKFLSKKDNILILSLIIKIQNLIKELEFEIKLKQESLRLPIEKLKEKTELFHQEALKIKQEKEDSNYILQGQIEKIIKETLVKDLEDLQKIEIPNLRLMFKNFTQTNLNLSGSELLKTFNQFIEKTIKNIFKQWRKEEEKKLQKILNKIIIRFSHQNNLRIQKIKQISSEIFNFEINKIEDNLLFAKEFEFRFAFDEYKINLDFYSPLISKLPKFLSHKLLYPKMERDLLNELDRHCGRCRYDFSQRINKSILDYHNKLERDLEQAIKNIEIILIKTIEQKGEQEQQEKIISLKLNQQRLMLNKIKKKLLEINRYEL
ncbi:hypothetical protein GYA19_01385 [Candidatus Beckwithbacteria bacterium]|nr:hypothetical protein [Candidatus Beckwithbacteria bacterium]